MLSMLRCRLSSRPIITNLDQKLTDAEIEVGERAERREAFVADRVRDAEKAEKGELVAGQGTDIVYTGLQRDDVITADPLFDKSVESIRGRRSLPIKQFEVEPDGSFALTLGEAAMEAVRLGLFCHACHDRQPDNDIEWGAAMLRLEDRIGARPSWAEHGTMCCYCGARLGIHGEQHLQVNGLWNMPPDQRAMLEKMFGPIRAAG